ncbi:MAG: hypothetical protein AAGC57_07930 [Pseudomonadota bacterium]
MPDATAQDLTPAIGQLRRYGWVSTAIGGFALLIFIALLSVSRQYTVITGLALGIFALQMLALAVLFLPAFFAFRTELRQGIVRVDLATERAAKGPPPRWLILVYVGIVVIVLAEQIWGRSSNGVGIMIVILLGAVLATRGWPTHETQAQKAAGAAGLGMFGLKLSMLCSMFAGVNLARSGALDVPDVVVILGFTALMAVPAIAVFFSTLSVIRRAGHAH